MNSLFINRIPAMVLVLSFLLIKQYLFPLFKILEGILKFSVKLLMLIKLDIVVEVTVL